MSARVSTTKAVAVMLMQRLAARPAGTHLLTTSFVQLCADCGAAPQHPPHQPRFWQAAQK